MSFRMMGAPAGARFKSGAIHTEPSNRTPKGRSKVPKDWRKSAVDPWALREFYEKFVEWFAKGHLETAIKRGVLVRQ